MKKVLNRFAISAFVLALSSPTLFAATPTSNNTLVSGIDTKNNNNAVRAQDDFFDHVNGTWIKNTQIPADKTSWGTFYMLADAVVPQLRDIITSLPTDEPNSEAQKLADLYASFLDTETIEAHGLKPLDGVFSEIDAITDKKNLPKLISYLTRRNINAPYRIAVHQNARDSSEYIVDFFQAGLGLPDRDYYLKDDDAKLKSIRDAYQKHIEKMLTMAGDTDAAESAAAIVKLETQLARIQWSKVQQRDPVKTYNKIQLTKLDALIPNHSLNSYLKALGVNGISYVTVSELTYFRSLSTVFRTTPLDTWKTYFKWHALSNNASLLPKQFADENFAFFGTTLHGVPEQEVRWKRGVRLVNRHMGLALGKQYVARHFPPEHKARMEKLVGNLLAAYKQSIDQLDWMGPATKKEAQKKLATFMPKIGYPVKWKDYSTLVIKKDDLVGNNLRAYEFAAQFDIDKLGKPVDRTEWFMPPQTVNAYYNPEMNEIVFPAAILQPPFFDAKADDAVNYGGIGAVIGHEISHGFDDQGSQYDEKGNLRNWWTKQDHKKFSAKTAELVKQYNAYSPLPGYFVNGELTLGENIADNSGLAIALKAYKISLNGKPAPVIDGLTGEQRFYIGYAQVWMGKSRDEALLVQIKTDPHSPAQFRTNGTVRNQPAFYEAFDVKEGDKMFLAPGKRVIIW